jgi:YD repeat-containing protein
MKRIAFLLLLLPATLYAGQPPGLAKGFEADKIYDYGGIDSINTFNGNLTLRIPIGPSFSVGGDVSYALALTYNSKVWDYEDIGTSTHAIPSRRSNAGIGWMLTLGRMITDSSNDTGRPLYESPDGADHEFFDKLHESDPDVTPPSDITRVGYTRDGSYLRLIQRSGITEIESPDGIVRKFDTDSGDLLEIRDRSGNSVSLSTPPAAETPCQTTAPLVWAITDSANVRTNYVCFENSPGDPYYDRRIQKVLIAAPPLNGARTATYELTYATTPSILRGCHSPYPKDPASIESLPRLDHLKLPDGSEFSFRYNVAHTNLACESGTLSGLTLPTGGTMEYVYRYWEIPVAKTSCSGFQWKSFLTGVGTRTVAGEHAPSGTWTYAAASPTNPSSYVCENNNGAVILHPPPGPAEEMTVTLTDPASNVTEYSYSVWPGANWSYNGSGGYDPSLKGFTFTEYGQPFTRRVSSGGGYLSRRVYSATGYSASPKKPLRSYYLKQERDGTLCVESLDSLCLKANHRTKFERTVYDDDDSATADVSYDLFDGLGHYREVTASGSFGSSIKTTVDYNKRNSDVNPNNGINSGTYPDSFTLPAPETRWILNSASKITTVSSSKTLVTQQCHDESTGLLLGRRTLATSSAIAAHDLLALFQYTGGNLTSEAYYGGNKEANAPTGTSTTLCGIMAAPPASFEYKLTHEYTAGRRQKTQYANVSFLSLNRAIDAASGVTTSESDVSGQETTTYAYDTSYRLTAVTPPGDATTSIEYTNKTATATASVTVTAGTAQETYRYDGLGRVWRQKRLMPDGTWSLAETQRNALGWTTQSSEFQTVPSNGSEANFSPSHFTVFSEFDPFGRPGKTTSPANDVITFTYSGARQTKRTQKLATSTTGETSVVTTETFDPHGRLVDVLENDGGTDAASTVYTYDVTGQLEGVSWQTAKQSNLQPRTFTYDGRGLLISENHPESGTTSYQYDSRGHVTSRTTPVATLTMSYDKAERLQTVSQTGLGVLKQYTYDRSNTSADSSLGKLATATRHNYVLNSDIAVTETYRYEQEGGRVSSRQSSIPNYGTFVDGYSYDDLGNVTTITYPQCSNCPGLDAPQRTVTNLYSGKFLTAVRGYTSETSPMTYDGNGMLTAIRHLDVGGGAGPLYTQTPDNGLSRPQQIKVEDYCELGLHTPLQPKSVTPGTPANLTVDAPGATSFKWYERINGADSILTGQNTATLTTTINATRFFWVRVGNGDCTADSDVVKVSAGSCPSPTISAPSSMERGSSASASVTAPGATYAWSIPDGSGTMTSATNGASVTFKASCSATAVNLQVVVTPPGCAPTTVSKSIAVWAPSAFLSSTPTIEPDGRVTLNVSFNGTGPWTITWSDGQTTSTGTRTVTPPTTTTYTLDSVKNGFNCDGSVSGSVTVTPNAPPAPTSVAVVMIGSPVNGTATLKVSWSYSGSADSFRVERTRLFDGWFQRDANASSPYFDYTPLENNTYLYRVIAIKNGVASAPSIPDLAATIAFEPIYTYTEAQSLGIPPTRIRAQQIMQLRTAASGLSVAAGMSSPSFTDPDLTNRVVKLEHVMEVKAVLDQALFSLFGRPPIAYTGAPPTRGGPIRAEHLRKLQDAVK